MSGQERSWEMPSVGARGRLCAAEHSGVWDRYRVPTKAYEGYLGQGARTRCRDDRSGDKLLDRSGWDGPALERLEEER